MSQIFKEMPTVFPFYEEILNQDRYRENVADLTQFKLISPRNALLPFQIELPAGSTQPPVLWQIIPLDGSPIIDLTSNNLNRLQLYVFGDKSVLVYKGLAMRNGIGTLLRMPCGYYYSVMRFPSGKIYTSEIFYVPANDFPLNGANDFLHLEFWNDYDITPILYRDNFRQSIYLDTFVSSYTPEINEDVEKDGFNNEIPTFQKLVLKYKFTDIVPDFVKIALVSLQMHDHINFKTRYRSGIIDRISVTPQPMEGEGLNTVDVVFEDKLMYKTNCNENPQASSVITW